MASIYGHKWESSYGPHDAGDVWLMALSCFTPRDLANGLNKCVTSQDPWPPSAPEFRGMCMVSAADHGLMDARAAYRAACDYYGRRGDPTRIDIHSTIRQGMMLAGSYSMLVTMNQDKAFQAFERGYESAVDQFMAVGEPNPGMMIEKGMREQTQVEKQAAEKYAGFDTDDQAAQAARADLKQIIKGI